MKTHTRSLMLAAALCGAAFNTTPVCAEDRPLHIHGAAEVEIETERGKSYKLQHSDDMVTWQDVDDSVYGHGGRENRLVSTRRNGSSTNGFFRLVVAEVSTNGFAPWSLAGVSVQLDDRVGGDALQFLSETNGVKVGSTTNEFVYTLTRTDTNTVKIETHPPTYYFDRRDVYQLTYTGPAMGTWVRDEYRRNQLRDRDVGVFRQNGGTHDPSGGSTNPPPVVPTEIPSALAGLAFTFQSGETPERLEFSSSTTGTEFGDDVADDELNIFTYVYAQPTTNSATITVTFSPGKWDEYTLAYTGPAGGTFERREFKDGVLSDTDHGAFSVVVMPSGSHGGGNPPDVGPMPTGSSLEGLTYAMNDGSPTVIRLVVASATAGTQLDDSAPTDFTYTFALTGAETASLVVRFKADKWDEYDLTFVGGNNSGSFIRREYDKSALTDTDSGTFTGQRTNP